MSAKRLSHAIVLGGSAAGLFATRVLASNADRVTLIERDPLPQGAVHRKGTPQSRHANNVLYRAVRVLEDWFPGLTDELTRAGAVQVTDDARVVMRGIRYARTEGAPPNLLLTRPLLDAALRARIRALSNVEVLEGTEATGLITDKHKNVRGVYINGESDERPLQGDVVIDAMGRGSRGRTWLAALGYESPDATEIYVDVHYATRLFGRRATDLQGDRLALVSPTVNNPRGAVAFAIEGDRWLVTIFSYGGVRPPRDLAGFRAFAATLEADDIAALVANAAPLDEGAQFGYPSTMLRRFDRLRRVPDGYLALGDSLCQLNPCYGQGITSATLQARALERALAEGGSQLPRRYYRRAVAAASAPFELSWTSDAGLPWVRGPASPTPKLIQKYMRRAMRVAALDPTVSTAIRGVMAMIHAPTALLRPQIALRVLGRRLQPAQRASRGLARPVQSIVSGPEATR